MSVTASQQRIPGFINLALVAAAILGSRSSVADENRSLSAPTVPAWKAGLARAVITPEKSDCVGHECHLVIPGASKSDKYKSANEFLMAKLLEKNQ